MLHNKICTTEISYIGYIYLNVATVQIVYVNEDCEIILLFKRLIQIN